MSEPSVPFSCSVQSPKLNPSCVAANQAWPWWLNGVIFQFGWTAAVIGGNRWGLLACVVMLMLHGVGFVRQRREWLLIIVITGIGCLIDSGLFYWGVLVNEDGSRLMPFWLVAVWLMFSMTLCHVFSWLHHRLGVGAFLGAVFAPLSYLGGGVWAPVSLAQPLWQSLGIMAVIWLLLFPAGLLMARRVYAHSLD